jgi:hypothetical protein
MFDRLQEDHRRIALLSAWLEALIADAPAPPAGLADARHTLVRETLRHIAAEERQVFRPLGDAAPAWLARERPGHQRGAVFARFITEHCAYWDTPRIAADWRAYRIALAALTAALRERMRHEEARLYPRAILCLAAAEAMVGGDGIEPPTRSV